MSRPHDGHHPSFPFGNPFRMIFPKGSCLPPRLFSLLSSFEETLTERLKRLKTKYDYGVLSLSWMSCAMESLSETHTDIKTLITDLQFPVSDWDDKWMDMYLDDSVKLLDICIGFSSELSRLDQGQLLLQYVLHVLDFSRSSPSAEQLARAHTSLDDWRLQQINSRSTKLGSCSSVLQGLHTSLHMEKSRNSSKGKVLMRALFGVKVQTIFICSTFIAALSCSSKVLTDLVVPDKFLWSEAFNDLQGTVNGEIRKLFLSRRVILLKELEVVDKCAEKLYALTDGVGHETDLLRKSVSELGDSAEKLSGGVELLSKQVGVFFQIVLSGRDALLSNLRVPDILQENNLEKHL
ncbi:hypothetical protein QJS04_geneDACA013157 [Acorus gramineus]|uniref:Uncharacterized protein n=1 Tax=Acorus gramineus TaxID=55184 RepID=A0AAV9B7D2_ACOGR|nr:hypothetical protein QJS04_geneDACA013157 [Acorus gramineus]